MFITKAIKALYEKINTKQDILSAYVKNTVYTPSTHKLTVTNKDNQPTEYEITGSGNVEGVKVNGDSVLDDDKIAQIDLTPYAKLDDKTQTIKAGAVNILKSNNSSSVILSSNLGIETHNNINVVGSDYDVQITDNGTVTHSLKGKANAADLTSHTGNSTIHGVGINQYDTVIDAINDIYTVKGETDILKGFFAVIDGVLTKISFDYDTGDAYWWEYDNEGSAEAFGNVLTYNRTSQKWEYLSSLTGISDATLVTNATLDTALDDKQDTLTAGSNITITGTTISATGQTQSDWNQTNTTAVDYIKNKPTILTNDSIVIKNDDDENVISLSVYGAEFAGCITINSTDEEAYATIEYIKIDDSIDSIKSSGSIVTEYDIGIVDENGDYEHKLSEKANLSGATFTGNVTVGSDKTITASATQGSITLYGGSSVGTETEIRHNGISLQGNLDASFGNIQTSDGDIKTSNGEIGIYNTSTSTYTHKLSEKADATTIAIGTKGTADADGKTTTEYALTHNTETRFGTKTSSIVFGNNDTINITVPNSGYGNDFMSGLMFHTDTTAPTISYTANRDTLQWVGTDCKLTGTVSTFTPKASYYYDIVFYYNGYCFVGLVNGYALATSNEED